MKGLIFSRYALSSCLAAAMLSGCGGSQPPIGAPAILQRGPSSAAQAPTVTGYEILYRFGGDSPQAPLIEHNGTFYGTTPQTVFSITPSGMEKVLHTFGSGSDGADAVAGLIYVHGLLYGTTEGGGAYCSYPAFACGTVFSITTSGIEKVLHSFGNGSDGADPFGGLIDVGGTLYGTTEQGGDSGCGGTGGCGTVFSISTSGAETVLHSFGGGSTVDGVYPQAGLHDMGGTLYGTTYYGGENGSGTVFSITTSGTEKVRHSFPSFDGDGAAPDAGLTDVSGTLYGTTAIGGAYCCRRGHPGGTVFSIAPSGSETVLHSFGKGIDGAGPRAGLIYVHGTLYGTTEAGGAHDRSIYRPGGTIFGVSTSGTETVLHSFGKGNDGAFPVAGLIYAHGMLYGTTQEGGRRRRCGGRGGNCGIVFALTP